MDKERDFFEGLRWSAKIVRLAEFHVLFNPSLERRVSDTKRYHNDY